MKYFALIALLLAGTVVKSQDIPLFSQKLTNSFIYNPAMAGISKGSLTFSHRANYAGTEGSPSTNFLSFHSPFANYRFGFGVNMFQEEVAAIKTTYFSSAFAYHIDFNRFSTLSFGVSGEFNSIQLTDEAIAQNNGQDLILTKYANGVNQPDFSFGINYSSRLWKFGIAANRLNSAWFETDADKALVSYYSAFVQGVIPFDGGRSILEPYAAYRKFSETNSVYDIGLFYTYNNKLIAGVATRSGSIINGTVGYNITKNLMVGYSREIILGSVGGYVGSSNEFVLRLDFRDRTNKQHFRADYKSAVAYRMKAVTNVSVSNQYRALSNRSPKQARKFQKRMAPYSPNKRYQDMRKLSGGKKLNQKSAAIKRKASPNPAPSVIQKARAQKHKYKGSSKVGGSSKKRMKGSAFKNNKYNPVKKKKRR